MSSFEVIIRNSVELDRVLSQNLSAKGPDLHAKLDSVRWRLPGALIAQLEFLIAVRDEAVNAAVVPADATDFEYAFASVIQAFERMVGSGGGGETLKTPESVKAPVIAPTVQRAGSAEEPVGGPMTMTAFSAWHIAQQDVAIQQMLDALLTDAKHELTASALDEAPPPLVEIFESHDEPEGQALPKQVTIGALLVRPSLE